jgi:hypothetical protein
MPRSPGTAERRHRRERRGLGCNTAARNLRQNRTGSASWRFDEASTCGSRPSSRQRCSFSDLSPALTGESRFFSQSKRLLWVEPSRLLAIRGIALFGATLPLARVSAKDPNPPEAAFEASSRLVRSAILVRVVRPRQRALLQRRDRGEALRSGSRGLGSPLAAKVGKSGFLHDPGEYLSSGTRCCRMRSNLWTASTP